MYSEMLNRAVFDPITLAPTGGSGHVFAPTDAQRTPTVSEPPVLEINWRTIW
jgi:hypothetical protein